MAVEDAWFMIDKVTGKKVPTKRHGRGKRWRVRNPGAPTRSFFKKSDADAHDTKVKNDLLQGLMPFDHKAGLILFKLYANKCVEERYHNEGSLKVMRSRLKVHLIAYFGEKRMCDIKPSTVSSFRADMRTKRKKLGKPGEKLAPRTIKLVDALLVTIMRSAKADGVIAEDPCAKATPQQPVPTQKVRAWEQPIVDSILTGLPDRYHAIGLVSATCGHRQGESFAVAKDALNFLRKEITIDHQVQMREGKLVLCPPKRGKTRTVPMPTVTSNALALHIKRYGTITVRCVCCGVDHEVLFSLDGKLMNHRVWDLDYWHRAVEGAELTPSRRTGQHQLRHVYASTLIEGGASMEQVRDYMGHKSITTTAEIYGHLFARSHDKARKILDRAFSGGAYPLRTVQDR